MEPLRDPELGHIVMTSRSCEAFIEHIREMDDDLLASTGRDWAWLLERRGWSEAKWKLEQCRAEWKRRQAMRHQSPPVPGSQTESEH